MTRRALERRQREQSAARQRRAVGIAAVAIVLVLIGLVALRFQTGSSSTSAAPDSPAPEALVASVTSVPQATLEQVGRGTVATLPIPVRAAVERDPRGLPVVTYVGAEYCPFCAGERWPLVVALSRFGTFTGLKLSHSASEDVFPNTATFSFVGSSYSSQYANLSAVELQTNVRSGTSYQTLQTPTPAQAGVLQMYDVPPYVPASSAGAIPFIDFAGQYILPGATFDVGVLRAMTQDQIVAALSDPKTPQAQAILGSANAITAAICSATGDTPSDVCGLAAVKSIEATLAATTVPGK